MSGHFWSASKILFFCLLDVSYMEDSFKITKLCSYGMCTFCTYVTLQLHILNIISCDLISSLQICYAGFMHYMFPFKFDGNNII